MLLIDRIKEALVKQAEESHPLLRATPAQLSSAELPWLLASKGIGGMGLGGLIGAMAATDPKKRAAKMLLGALIGGGAGAYQGVRLAESEAERRRGQGATEAAAMIEALRQQQLEQMLSQ